MKRRNKTRFKFTWEIILVGIVLTAGLFLRVFKIETLLDFHFDQGRDASVIWNLIHNSKFFLIGPTTGIEGIFRGPWYYWLITPWYWVGKGNPVFPSVFLSITTVLASFVTYILGKRLGGKWGGVIALTISCFSGGIVLSSRWLSNPTPMFLISVLTVWLLDIYFKGKNWSLILVGFLLGQAMQFGSAAEIFYFPAIIISFLVLKKKVPSIKLLVVSILATVVSFTPLLVFDLRHKGILLSGLIKFLTQGDTFSINFWEIVKQRGALYWEVFTDNLWVDNQTLILPFVGLAIYLLISNFKVLWQNQLFKIITIFTFTPLIGLLFFQGNNGVVYGYYLTGYYLIFVLYWSAILARGVESFVGKLAVIVFLGLVFGLGLNTVVKYFSKSQNDWDTINLGNQKRAIDAVYQKADKRPFNLDIYVPPVIPHSYNYLLTWYGNQKYGYLPSLENLDLLFTLYEVDPPHPQRLDEWLTRQDGIGEVISEDGFGGIIVQERKRILFNNP